MAEPGRRSITGSRWVLRTVDDGGTVERLRAGLGVCSMTARALVCRGISEAEQARIFLGHDLGGLIDPFQMKDMDRAVAAVDAALKRGARIRIYGTTMWTGCARRRCS